MADCTRFGQSYLQSVWVNHSPRKGNLLYFINKKGECMFLDLRKTLKGYIITLTSRTRCFSGPSNNKTAGRDKGGGDEVNSQFLLRFEVHIWKKKSRKETQEKAGFHDTINHALISKPEKLLSASVTSAVSCLKWGFFFSFLLLFTISRFLIGALSMMKSYYLVNHGSPGSRQSQSIRIWAGRTLTRIQTTKHSRI